ncbi:hypothetical protein PanWU01x14_063160 [Parasponia andersonii]|uniref:Uncharacterized protein n=1 Tax=Parasponia andersonii TaxID=3476 RepID=A0A2P5DHR9_PARAD|nr:hypothetical protein PanWU01x14_063160 [Parasponia andersonii]
MTLFYNINFKDWSCLALLFVVGTAIIISKLLGKRFKLLLGPKLSPTRRQPEPLHPRITSEEIWRCFHAVDGPVQSHDILFPRAFERGPPDPRCRVRVKDPKRSVQHLHVQRIGHDLHCLW